jgi:branched-chain amino acid transport system ATP-binding protein
MSEPLLEVVGLRKLFGGFIALNGVDIAVAPGERLGMIGPNGSGKSTFVNCVSGALRGDAGRIRFVGAEVGAMPAHRRARLGLVRSFQLPRPFASLTVAENLRIPLIYSLGGRGRPALGDKAIAERVEELLALVGIAGKGGHSPRDLTQVDMRKLELARAIAAEPRLLIADEAMAGLSHNEVDEILALLMRLNESGVAILMIEHIMRAVLAFSQRLVVLVAGAKIADGAPTEVLRHPEVERAYLGQ